MRATSSTFTLKERQIVELLARGKTSKEIAEHLNITIGTVGSHRKALCRKLNVHSTAELIQYATIDWVSQRIFL
jgi:DNA-binding CsgD family transcriptional regulator